MYTVEAIPADELGNSSFLVADPDTGVGIVVDPLRDIERYLQAASRLNVKLSHSLVCTTTSFRADGSWPRKWEPTSTSSIRAAT